MNSYSDNGEAAAQEALKAEEEHEENMRAIAAQAEAEAEILASDKPDEVVFITVYKKDRAWINETKGGRNRESRLHQVLENYRKAVAAGVIKDE